MNSGLVITDLSYQKNVINDKIDAFDKCIIEAISQNKYITILELALIVGKSEPTIHRHLNYLSKLKIIQRVGSRKSNYWEILKRVF